MEMFTISASTKLCVHWSCFFVIFLFRNRSSKVVWHDQELVVEWHKEQDGASHEEEEQDDVDDVHCAKGRVWEWNVCSEGVPEGEYIHKQDEEG